MKRVWTIISILAVANLLALGGFVGWLKTSGRLNKERMQQLRELFAPTIAESAKQAADVAAKKSEEEKKIQDAARSQRPPYGAMLLTAALAAWRTSATTDHQRPTTNS